MIDELRAACLQADVDRGWSREPCDVMKEWWQNEERRQACPEVWGVPLPVRSPGGGRCVTTPRSRERFVHPVVPQLVAPGEMARRYLRGCVRAAAPLYRPGSPMRPRKGSPRLPFRRTALGWFDIPRNASYYKGGLLTGEWAVVDITSAYYSIVIASPMDLWLRVSGDRVSARLGRCEFLRAGELSDKGVQRAIVGMFARRDMACERYGKPHVYPWSSFCGPDLTGLVHLTMSAIAWEAVRDFGAVHFATDAAIVPLERRDLWAAHLASAWGLSSHVIAEGPGTLVAHNTWEIGEQSRNHQRIRTTPAVPVTHLAAMSPRLVASVRGLRADLVARERDDVPWPA